MHLFDLLRSDGSITVNKRLAHIIGLNEAIIYSELISLHQYWNQRGMLKENEWFFCTIENIQNNTTLKRSKQDTAIANLIKFKLIETKKMGIPAKRYFRITDGIYALIQRSNQHVENQHTKYVENQHTGLYETDKQDGPKSAINNTIYNNTNNKEINNNIERPLVPFYNWLEERG